MFASGFPSAMARASNRSKTLTFLTPDAYCPVSQRDHCRARLAASLLVLALTSGGVDMAMNRMFGFAWNVGSNEEKCCLYSCSWASFLMFELG